MGAKTVAGGLFLGQIFLVICLGGNPQLLLMSIRTHTNKANPSITYEPNHYISN
jgi:hypothetical protein